jgi:IrrE N-terminal-like domain
MLNISEEAIQDKAIYVREKLGLSNVLAPNMYAVLEKLQTMIEKFSFRAALTSDMGGNEATMNEDTHTLTARECVLEDAKSGGTRARFTLAHELGHYFLGHKGERRRNANKALYAGANERIEEQEADLFASYFLVPNDLAWNALCSDEISQHFQVSGAAAEIALERIRKAKRKASGQRRQPPGVLIDFLKEAKRLGREIKSDISEFE